MNFIKASYEILEQQEDLAGIHKQIELAGRTCYHSEDKITADSAKCFVERMIKSGHGAMLEHGTVYLAMPMSTILPMSANPWYLYTVNPYSKGGTVCEVNGEKRVAVTTNLRVLVDNGRLDDLQYLCDPTPFHERRVTVKFTCDRVTGESFLRHRTIDEDHPSVEGEVTRESERDVDSFARESTRYCNYTKEKFGSELTYVQPSEITDEDIQKAEEKWNIRTLERSERGSMFRWMCSELANGVEYDDMFGVVDTWLFAGLATEWVYNRLISLGWKPQQARRKLTMDIKSPLVMTAFVSDWKHFFELRADPAAHPQAQELAIPLQKEFYKKGLLVDSEYNG